MDSPILKQIANFMHEQKKHRRWMVVFVSLAVIVGLGTAFALKMMGQAMTRKEKVLICTVQPHTHTEECQDAEGNLICGLADYIVHMHNDDCYDSDGNLTCQLAEIAPHQHEEACYADEQVLICGQEESEGHLHEDICYENQITGLGCTVPEHQHSTAGCFDEEGNLICEAPEHQHSSECYDELGNLICGQASHTHAGSCFDEESNLICTAEEHLHDANCLTAEDVLVCEEEEGADGHTHTEECYETQRVLACGQFELHTHSLEAGCYEEIPPAEEGQEPTYQLICELPQLEEHIHTEEAGCFEIHEAHMLGIDLGTETTAPEEEVAEQPGTEAVSAEEPGVAEAVSGEEPAVVTAEDAQAAVSPEEPDELVKTYNGEGFIVTAIYGKEANLPDEAELIAELITPENDKEHYAEREAEFKEHAGSEEATMSALLKVGFYINGEEIEPEAAVKVSVQLLDENGLPEGMPMTVVHFAEEGNEVLKGSNVEGGRTSFEMNSFSELAIGYSAGDRQTVIVNKTQVYDENRAFQITFHLTGEVKLPEGVMITAPGNTVTPSAPSDGGAGQAGEENDTQLNDDGTPEAEVEEGNEASDTQDGTADAPDDEEGTAGTGTDNGNNGEGESEENFLSQQLDFRIEPVEKTSAEYKAIKKQAEETAADGSEVLSIFAVSYALTYDEQELELNNCEVEATITPTAEFGSKVEISMVEAVAYLLENKVAQLTADQKNITGLEVTGLELDGDGTVNQENTMYIDDETQDQDMQVSAPTKDTVRFFAVRAAGQPNPKFTVEYYAYLDKVAWQGDKTGSTGAINGTNVDWATKKTGHLAKYRNSITAGFLPIIDTSKDRGGSLPVNGMVPKLNSVKVDPQTKLVETTNELTEVYSSRVFEYHKAPTINYFNALIDNASYKLKAVWVKKPGNEKWTEYTYSKELHFTNREETAKKNSNYVWIEEGTCIRLVYDPKKDTRNNPAIFYDYDVYMQNTERKGAYGINSDENYPSVDSSSRVAKYAFGNSDGSNYGEAQVPAGSLVNSRLNMGNWYDNSKPAYSRVGSYGYAGCTFGLVKSVDVSESGSNVQFDDNVIAPEIFGTRKLTGKYIYSADENQKFSLDFIQQGDTYTLTAVHGTKTTQLEQLENADATATDAGTLTFIKTNHFWPFDNDQHNDKVAGNKSDESGNTEKEHNNYFGMYYEVSFDLDPEYIGPLEYLFFGDDDMWVFLDNDTLVCDIGGVHSSVGEYVNLWDYLHKHTVADGCYDENGNLTCKQGSHMHTDSCYAEDAEGNKVLTCTENKHTLKFFYTERGASGSSCWMQFTLPSVSSMTPETTDADFGHLEIDKKVLITAGGRDYPVKDLYNENQQQASLCNEKEFTFKIALQGLVDDYAYVKYDRDGNPISSEEGGTGIITWDNTIADGETFTLKNGEYIRIRYLPTGTAYTITEEREEGEGKTGVQIQGIVYDSTHITVDQNDVVTGLQADGTIEAEKTSKVHYVNKYHAFELPKTGGPGKTPYTIAGVIVLFGAGFLYRKKFRERRV